MYRAEIKPKKSQEKNILMCWTGQDSFLKSGVDSEEPNSAIPGGRNPKWKY